MYSDRIQSLRSLRSVDVRFLVFSGRILLRNLRSLTLPYTPLRVLGVPDYRHGYEGTFCGAIPEGLFVGRVGDKEAVKDLGAYNRCNGTHPVARPLVTGPQQSNSCHRCVDYIIVSSTNVICLLYSSSCISAHSLGLNMLNPIMQGIVN
jgi:hypothetical protein